MAVVCSASEAYASNLESKLLVAVAKVCCGHIHNGQQLSRRGVYLQNGTFLTFTYLKEKCRNGYYVTYKIVCLGFEKKKKEILN